MTTREFLHEYFEQRCADAVSEDERARLQLIHEAEKDHDLRMLTQESSMDDKPIKAMHYGLIGAMALYGVAGCLYGLYRIVLLLWSHWK